jgi:ABC-type polysaccharide/polyol phosphate transport system ATPase subunit
MIYITLKKVSLSIKDLDIKNRLFQKVTRSQKKNELLGVDITSDRANLKSMILQNISFDANEGDKVGVVGHNGCGKTTLLRLLSSIYHPSEGEVIIKGQTLPYLNVSQVLAIEGTGYNNIEIIYRFLKNYDFNESVYDKVAEISGVGEYFDTPIKYYSAGMLARLLFAIILLNPKDIMLFDEGLLAGDAIYKEKAIDYAKNLINKTKISFFASHDLSFLKNICNKLIVMKRGKIKLFQDASEGLKFYESDNYKNLIFS